MLLGVVDLDVPPAVMSQALQHMDVVLSHAIFSTPTEIVEPAVCAVAAVVVDEAKTVTKKRTRGRSK